MENLGGTRPPSLEELDARLRNLATTHPDRVSLRPVGRTAGGRPLHLLTVQGGPRSVLVLAPHLDDPVGLATLDALAHYASRDTRARDRVTWHFVPCCDPDGAARQDQWWLTRWPVTMEEFHRDLYRPGAAGCAQQHADVRGFGAGQPETTTALEKAADLAAPRLLVALHSADWWNCNCLVRHATSKEFPLASLPTGCVSRDRPGSGLFVLPGPGPAASRHAPLTLRHYAARSGALGFVPEVPMWSTRSFAQPPEQGAAVLDQAQTVLASALRRIRPENDEEALLALTGHRLLTAVEAASLQVKAERVSGHPLTQVLPLFAAGLLLRHTQMSPGNPLEEGIRDRFFDSWCRRAEDVLRPTPVPLAEAVAAQIGTIMQAVNLIAHQTSSPRIGR
ncbi:M14 family zinc carboxypeptidase [Streptomyces sp. NPDC004549]|uniref:M14 family zinc carboxypeptidase n=1 Tax=Streptomyces sp. NPDC004549 TaxID=3154283 RepID=UPI0033A50A6A